MTRSFFVPLQPPSLNPLMKRGGYYKKINTKAKWADWIPPLVMKDRARGRVRLKVTRYYTGHDQEMDLDNLVGGLKPILDLLKSKTGAGYIVDDSPQWLILEPPLQVRAQYQGARPPAAGTLFEFEEETP